MFSERPYFRTLCSLSVAAFALLFALPIAAQDSDTNPNSPTPVLLSIEGSPRTLTVGVNKDRKYSTDLPSQEVLAPGKRAVLFVANLDLMEGEDAGAFRVHAEDSKGHTYRFPVLEVAPAAGQEGIYALTIRLTDEVGYWTEPIPLGDLTVYVAWRGLATNVLKLGYGKIGGKIKSESSLKAAPASEYVSKGSKFASAPPEQDFVGYRFSGDRIRFMEQAGFGSTPALDFRIRRIGLRVWLAEQLDAPYPTPGNPYPDIALKSTNQDDTTLGCGMFASGPERDNCNRTFYSMYPLQNWFFKEAFYGDSQLRHRVAWALAQLWVTSGVTTQQSSWAISYHKVLSQNAFGNYRNLMKEMTLNPTMGNYLDMVRSTRNNPNENYPREILQLFSVGLFELNQNGTLKLDGSNNPIPTYDQDKVNNFTKVFTGWTFCNIGCPSSAPGIVNYKDPLILSGTSPNFGSNHDLTAKTLFNYPGAPNPTIPACTGCTGATRENYAKTSLDQTLDNIFNHPNVGPFVSKILIQHLVTSDPTPAYVSRVAAVFNNNGSGTRGDLRAVVKAILLDPEARGDVKTDPNFGKLREPVQLMTNLFRHVGVKGAAQTGLSDGVVNGQTNGMAQNAFNSPTVFNYYPPDNVIPGTALLGPEFALMTTGTSISRANFVNTMVFSQIALNTTDRPNGTSLDFAELQALSTADPTSARLVDLLNTRMLHGTMTPAMRTSILTAVNAIAANNPAQRAKQAVYLVATSAQFQVQR
ncbi:MAG TPA: DUF1800 family protein [Pyrinomonadaceae bacterium]|nr:DUF1800 family protein [Pyrinomonadaceae bacterium]